MVAPAIEMNLAPFLHAIVLAFVWNKVLLVGQIITLEDSIAAKTGDGGSSPGRALGLIVIATASIPSLVAAAIIVLAIALSVSESVTMRTFSPGFA
jgi:hypothetical protein